MNHPSYTLIRQSVHSSAVTRYVRDYRSVHDSRHAYATGLCLSVVCRLLSVMLCIVAKRCVLEQSLLLTAEVTYGKSIGTKMNDIYLCLEVVSRSCQPLRDIRR